MQGRGTDDDERLIDDLVDFTETLQAVIEKCVPEASVRDICTFGDKLIVEETGKQFKKEKDLKKGKECHGGLDGGIEECTKIMMDLACFRNCLPDVHIREQLYLSLLSSCFRTGLCAQGG